MKVSALFHHTVISCTDRDHLEAAASQLWRHNIGCLPVVGDRGRLVGMITDRDIAIAVLLQGGPLNSITVSSVMSKEVMTCQASDDVEAVVERMTARRLRRLPVVDDDGHLLGILSLNDIARAAVADQLTAAGVAGVLAAVAVPRSLAVTAP
jgi:CBS domain-containing protein